ncbi:uncharacterized protein LOC143032277 [Oratosquilla oratoria]|uniref:uncharacterized protein LOC143032277 n=1 Tax=Oratosquilla oratoria TaxID=337810 RepID=UPI003F75FDFA
MLKHKKDQSQIPIPTYALAKRLHELIIPYVPSYWLLKSLKEFIDLLHNKAPTGLIASLDTESLFSNVPVIETINFVLDRVYHSIHVPLDIPETLLCKLLEACTTESPFRGPDAYLEDISRRLSLEKKVLKINGDYLNHLRFADNINVISESAEDLQDKFCVEKSTQNILIVLTRVYLPLSWCVDTPVLSSLVSRCLLPVGKYDGGRK